MHRIREGDRIVWQATPSKADQRRGTVQAIRYGRGGAKLVVLVDDSRQPWQCIIPERLARLDVPDLFDAAGQP